MEQNFARAKKCDLLKFLCLKWNVQDSVYAREHLKKMLFESWAKKILTILNIERRQNKNNNMHVLLFFRLVHWTERRSRVFMHETNMKIVEKNGTFLFTQFMFFMFRLFFCLAYFIWKEKKIFWKTIKYDRLMKTKVFWLACIFLSFFVFCFVLVCSVRRLFEYCLIQV